jgi:hypothetical protein
MTKVTHNFDVIRPLTDHDLLQIANVHSVYGMVRVQVAPSLEAITVDYDASRLLRTDVEAVLMRHGIPIRPSALAVA